MIGQPWRKNILGKVSDVPYWVVVDTIPENTKTKNVEKLQHPVLEYWCVRYVRQSSPTVESKVFLGNLHVRNILPGNVEI